jgi:hypothetical protein
MANFLGSVATVVNRTTLVSLALTFMIGAPAVAQSQGNIFPSASTPSVLPRLDFHFPGNVGRTYLDSDPPQFPQPVQDPKGAPNIVLILIDDAGFGQFSTFGGGVPSPTMDKLAGRRIAVQHFSHDGVMQPNAGSAHHRPQSPFCCVRRDRRDGHGL